MTVTKRTTRMETKRRAREFTNRLWDLIEEGSLPKTLVIEACLTYMSEDEVKDMCEKNDLLTEGYDDDYS